MICTVALTNLYHEATFDKLVLTNFKILLENLNGTFYVLFSEIKIVNFWVTTQLDIDEK